MRIYTVLTFALIFIFFQNCSQLGNGFEVFNFASTAMSNSSMDVNHPAPASAVHSSQSMQIANRQYVAELMRENFTSAAFPIDNLETLIQTWIENRDAQFGLGCDPYSTNTGRDCGGDISAANLPYTTPDNTVRQSYRIQFCDNALGTNNGVNAVIEKLPSRTEGPNAAGIQELYQLFYRGGEAPAEIITALLKMDRALATAGEQPGERWRAMILQVCTSPGWQLL